MTKMAPSPDATTKGWYAALADARLAARAAGNDWLAGKLNEIRAYISADLLEAAARLATLETPEGDWYYDDRETLAQAIRALAEGG